MKKQHIIVLSLLFLIALPNIVFVFYGVDTAVITPLKRIVFSVYMLSLVLFPLSFLKPKIYFLLLIPFLPFALTDLYVLGITNTQSTAMHYYSVFMTCTNEALEFVEGNIRYILFSVLYTCLSVFLLIRLQFSFRIRKKIRFYIGLISFSVIAGMLMRDVKIAYAAGNTKLVEKRAYHFLVKLNKTFPYGSLSKAENVYCGLKKTAEFEDNNLGFSYEPRIINRDKKTIVLVIGEAARRKNFQIYGYDRRNNPRLVKERHLIPFTHFTTCANFTLTSVAQIMSSVGPDNYEGAYKELSLMAAFKESGYKTYWITNQSYSPGSLYNLYSGSADVFEDTSTTLDMPNNDAVTLPVLDGILKDDGDRKFIVIHTIGSHYRYSLRYPSEFAKYKPEPDNNLSVSENGAGFKLEYVNSYDNSILFTDHYLAEIIGKLKMKEEQSIMMYLSDHGENLYDDENELFLHGTPEPSGYELEIPMFVWLSENNDKNIINRLNRCRDEKLSSEVVFHTLSDLGGFITKLHNPNKDLLSDSLMVGRRTVLKPDGSVMKID